MKIGHYRVCLTPQKPFYLIGYRSDNRMEPASGVHDDIFANCLLFEQSGSEVFIFSADVLEFEETMAEDVKTMLFERYGIERDAILLCATHNHSSIVSYHRSWYTQKFDPEYYEWFLNTICECYVGCKASLQPATCKAGSEIVTGFFGNRNHPGQLADNEVSLIQFYDMEGRPFAGLVNWAVHSTVISAENTWLTAELAGNVSRLLKEELGYYPAMIVGAAGDCSNRNERQGNDFAELDRVSHALSQIIGTIEMKREIPLQEIKIQTLFHTIHHDMKEVHEQLRSEIAKMEEEIRKNPSREKALRKRIENTAQELSVQSFHLDAKGWVINFGGMQMFVFPGELGSAFGKELKAACPVFPVIAGYTNGYYEYFMPAEEYGLSFETAGCKIPKGEPEKLIAKFVQTCKNLT